MGHSKNRTIVLDIEEHIEHIEQLVIFRSLTNTKILHFVQ